MAEHRMLTAAQITDFVLQICDILEYLHSQGSKGMVHLDLKPDNILITDTGSVKLIDFDNAVRMGEKDIPHITAVSDLRRRSSTTGCIRTAGQIFIVWEC